MDVRRSAPAAAPRGVGGFLPRAFLATLLVTYPAFALLCLTSLPVIASGALAAGAGMVANGLANRRSTLLAPTMWSQVAVDTACGRGSTGWPRRSRPTAPSPPSRRGDDQLTVPPSCSHGCARAVGSDLDRECSHRPQRRRGIDLTSHLLLPVSTRSGSPASSSAQGVPHGVRRLRPGGRPARRG